MDKSGYDPSERLDEIVGGYLDRLNAGEDLDATRIFEEHPDFGGEILDELHTFIDLGLDSRLGEGRPAEPLGTLGDYTLRRQIGRGGMGVVYEAWQNSMDRQVALKVMPKAIAVDTRAVARFIQEAQLAGKLSHPNIVHVHGMGVEQQIPYYAMDFVEGETLAQIVARLKAVEPEAETPFGPKDEVDYFARLARAFADVADGLQHAHSHKIIHRDIKPSNLILDREGRLRILDFGLARLEGQESLTASGDLVGTPQYMSPEQARRKKIPIDHRTDVYSLGATLYETLALQPPFRGRDHNDTLSQIIERDAVEPRRINPRVPRDLETIVLKCLRKEAGDRYGTAEALGQDLRRFMRGEVIEARAQSGWERTRKRLWRVRWRIGAGFFVGAALAVVIWSMVALRGETRARIEREYETMVVRGILRLEVASLEENKTTWLGMKLRAGEPAALALKDLDEASALLPDKPDALYHRARALLNLGREAEALQTVDGLLARRPPFVPASTLRAALLRARGDAAGAERMLLEVARLAGKPWEKTWIAISRESEAPDPADRIAGYTALLAQSAGGREPFIGCTLAARLGRGNAAFEAKDPAQALRDFTFAEVLVPGAVQPLVFAGKAWELLGHAGEAARVFEDVYTRATNKDEAAVAVSYVYAELKKDAEMEAWTKRIGEPKLRDFRLMNVYYDLGRWPEAIEAGYRATEADPESAEICGQLAFYLTQQRRYSESREVLERAIRKWPENPLININKAWNCVYEERFDEGVRYAEKNLAFPNKWHGDAQHTIGLCRIRQGRILEGEAAIQAALTLQPRAAYIYGNAGWSFLMIGKTQEALRYLDQAIQIEPTSAYFHNNKGGALAREGRLDEAIASLRIAKSLYPWLPYPGVFLGHVFLAQGKPSEALREYLAILERNPDDSSSWTSAPRISALLRRHSNTLTRDELEAAAAALNRGLEKSPGNAWVADALAQSLIAIGGEENLSRAATVAVSYIAGADSVDAGFSSLGRTLDELLDPTIQGGGPSKSAERALTEVKTLPSYRAIDIFSSTTTDPVLIEALRARAESMKADEIAARRLAYLDASVLARTGRHAEAAAKLAALVALEPEAVEPVLLLAEELRALGDLEKAEQALRTFLESSRCRDRRLWDAWLALKSVDQHRSPAEILAELPAPPVIGETLDPAASVAYRDDVRWLLERLSRGESIRIRCGGEEYRDPEGRVWGKDRFALGGNAAKAWVFEDREDIAGTDADPLFWMERAFDFRDAGRRTGYSFPMPPGRYRVRLLFAELMFKAKGLRRFDIVIQGETVLRGFEPTEVGFATATEKVFETSVTNGQLEIRFVHDLWEPKVSAIEIERVE